MIMKNLMRNTSRILSVLFIAGLTFVSVSCDDDDDVDCSKIQSQGETLFNQMAQAAVDGDCEELDQLEEKVISLAREAKSCQFIKDDMKDMDIDNFEEYILALRALIDSEFRDGGECGTPA